MSTIVRYECRNLDHLRTGSRRGKGGLVIHHGTVGCCAGLQVDGSHRWVATGGRPLVAVDGPALKRGPLEVGVKPSDDPDSPDGSRTGMTLLHLD
jgi:hypothetical protein